MPGVKPIVSRRTLVERAREQMKQRARELATRGDGRRMRELSAGQMVLCAVGPDVFAIPAQRVAETQAVRPLAALPGASASVLGLMWSGGSAVVVLHLGRLLGTTAATVINADAHIVVLRLQGRHVALLVDRVLAIADVTPAAPAEVASLAASDAVQHVRLPAGLAAASIAAVLDLERLIPNAVATAAPPGA